jgi:hypothetical protein
MHEFHFTFEELAEMTPLQWSFLVEGLSDHYKRLQRATRRRRR